METTILFTGSNVLGFRAVCGLGLRVLEFFLS